MQMLPLEQSFIEIRRAKEYLAKLSTSESLEEYEFAWKDLLHCLDRCFNKAISECASLPKFKSWNDNHYVSKRKKDPLLKYLEACRNANEHTIQPIVDKSPSSLEGFFQNRNGPNYIEKFNVDPVSGTVEYSGSPVNFIFTPAKVESRSVVVRGVPFSVPLIHIGQNIKNPKDPQELAHLGIKFYESYLEHIKKTFFKI